MKVIKVNQSAAEPVGSPLFFGGKVTIQSLMGPEAGRDLSIVMVNFEKGARNKLHTHTTDQLLIITAGKGIVATSKEEKAVYPGDIVFFQADEKHWHGAAADSSMSHLSVLARGGKSTIIED
jgi:quercetin dioxygenase-like cupin family protein